MSLPTRSIADMRSSARRSAGRGTAEERDTVVDSNAASPLPIASDAGSRSIAEDDVGLKIVPFPARGCSEVMRSAPIPPLPPNGSTERLPFAGTARSSENAGDGVPAAGTNRIVA